MSEYDIEEDIKEEEYCPVCHKKNKAGIVHPTGREINDCVTICHICSDTDNADAIVTNLGIKNCIVCGHEAHYTDLIYQEDPLNKNHGSYYCHDCCYCDD